MTKNREIAYERTLDWSIRGAYDTLSHVDT